MPINTVVYTPEGIKAFDDLQTAKETSGTTWVRVQNATEEEVERLETVFDIHTLATDDTVTNVRATVQEFDTHTFLLLKSAHLAAEETTFAEEITETPVGIFIGTDWIVTLSTGATEPVGQVWETILTRKQELLDRGPDFIAYRIANHIVDEYFVILDAIETQIEAVEDVVVTDPDTSILEEINNVRRELLAVRKLLLPAREAIGQLARGDATNIHEDTEKYYRDVYEHLIQLVELTETYRELAMGARDMYLNSMSVSTNEVMKRLTAVATVILPLTFITGIYGMNFTGSPYNMPELTWRYGYPAILLMLLGIGLITVGYFYRKDWL